MKIILNKISFFLFLLCLFTSGKILASQDVALEKQLIALINEERAKQRLQPLCEWDVLSYYACQHSANMADGSVTFGHDGFNGRANGVQSQAQIRSFAENVAYCYNTQDPLKVIVQKWMESPGHRKNILGDYRETGVGIVRNAKGYYYMTQLFSKRSM